MGRISDYQVWLAQATWWALLKREVLREQNRLGEGAPGLTGDFDTVWKGIAMMPEAWHEMLANTLELGSQEITVERRSRGK